MEKILLVGNGFTSQLIPEYKNKVMMPRIRKEVPDIFEKANQLFEPFRKKVDSVQFTTVGWGYCGGGGFCGLPPLNRPISGRPYNDKLVAYIEMQLEQYGFHEVQSASTDFFQAYGLIYETQHDEISNVESLLKIIALFKSIEKFTEEDQNCLKRVANRIYYNEGECGRSAIRETTSERIREWLTSYKMIFTTNYDTLLDEILQTDEIRHLHGGFLYRSDDRTKRFDTLIPVEDAYLIWGISGKEKAEAMKIGGSTSLTHLSPPLSIFSTYLSQLREVDAERIDIFGYSGENDQHINDVISMNPNIKQIHYFCDPKKVIDSVQKFEVKLRFGIKQPQQLELESWDVIWEPIIDKQKH